MTSRSTRRRGPCRAELPALLARAAATPRTYLTPKRLKSRPADPRSYLYAIGIILYELIAGRAPFIGADDFELISAHLHDDPPPLDLVAPTPPPEPVARLVMQALAKEPEHRFASALAMASAIEDASRSVATAG